MGKKERSIHVPEAIAVCDASHTISVIKHPTTGMACMIHLPHDHALDLDIDLLLHLHLHLRTLPRDMISYIESHTKKEEIVACHLKEESINPSLDQDLDQYTDRLHTIEKDQTGIKEEGQDHQGIRDGQCHRHVQYLQEGIQKYIPKQDP